MLQGELCLFTSLTGVKGCFSVTKKYEYRGTEYSMGSASYTVGYTELVSQVIKNIFKITGEQ
jgi:hypothetical protein